MGYKFCKKDKINNLRKEELAIKKSEKSSLNSPPPPNTIIGKIKINKSRPLTKE